jgi:hypothetical protein
MKNQNRDYITVQNGIGGYFAVRMTYEEDCDCFMPYETGMGRYKTRKEAEKEAGFWAMCEELEFVA